MEASVEALVALLITVGPMAIATTKLVDFLRNAFDKDGSAHAWVWNAAAFAVGIMLALLWQWNFIIPLLQTVPALAKHVNIAEGVAGQILTGLIIGAVASGWHEKFDEISTRAKANRANMPSGYSSP